MKKLTQNVLFICSITIVSGGGEKKPITSSTEAITNLLTQSSSETEKVEVVGSVLNNADALKKVEETLKILTNLKDKNIRFFSGYSFLW